MHVYHFKFVYDGEREPQVLTISGMSPGNAQARFHERFPGCRILEQWCNAQLRKGDHAYGQISYPAISTAKVEAIPAVKAKEQTFSFFDECISTCPIANKATGRRKKN
jgi:hypothetical protein